MYNDVDDYEKVSLLHKLHTYILYTYVVVVCYTIPNNITNRRLTECKVKAIKVLASFSRESIFHPFFFLLYFPHLLYNFFSPTTTYLLTYTTDDTFSHVTPCMPFTSSFLLQTYRHKHKQQKSIYIRNP